MSWDNVDEYFSGQGVVLLAKRKAGGALGPFYPAGNVSDLKLSIAVSTLEHKESKTGQRATDLRLTTETKVSLSMTGEHFSADNFARVSRGAAVEIAAGTETDFPLVGYSGGVTALGHLNVSSVVLKTAPESPAVPVTLTAYTDEVTPWDYRVNAEAGSIMLNGDEASWDGLTSGDFNVDGEAALTVSYSYAAQSRIDALTEGEEELFLRFEGLNTADENKPVVVEVFRMRSDPFKELSLISDGVQQFVLEGSVLYDGTRATGSKFFRVLK